jgi:RNA polymerase sigma-70 factor, ECF subfamily
VLDHELQAARTGDAKAFARLVEPFRGELRAHCYRMSGSLHDADDWLQESLIRAWRGLATFEGRASLRTWLYKVTTNVCLDGLRERGARTLPTELGPPADPSVPMTPNMDLLWLEPYPDDLHGPTPSSPETRYGQRESVALAFLVALQLLPATQRAVLILRDVLGLQASECAELLDSTVPAVNSALQRARETVESRADAKSTAIAPVDDPGTQALLAKYIEAWELADVNKLVALLHEDATLAMPPFSAWLLGPKAIGASIDAMVFGAQGAGGIKMAPTRANGAPAVTAYFRDAVTGSWSPRGVHVLEIREERITAIHAFLDGSLVEKFST